MGRGHAAEFYDTFKTNYFKWFNTLPDDVVGRHPMYRAMYRGRMRQELSRLDPTLSGDLTDAEQRVMEEQSRVFARREMKRLMFDASNKSNLGQFLRFTSPFYTAWEDVLRKYGRMVMQDPSLIPHAWQAVVRLPAVAVVEAELQSHDVGLGLLHVGGKPLETHARGLSGHAPIQRDDLQIRARMRLASAPQPERSTVEKDRCTGRR